MHRGCEAGRARGADVQHRRGAVVLPQRLIDEGRGIFRDGVVFRVAGDADHGGEVIVSEANTTPCCPRRTVGRPLSR